MTHNPARTYTDSGGVAWLVLPDGSRVPLPTPSAGSMDHGSLTGLGDNDHPQYVLKTGDTMSGNLAVAKNAASLYVDSSNAGGAATVWLKGNAGALRSVIGTTGDSLRWRLYLGNGAPESGGNAGSNLMLAAYADDGTLLGYPLTGIRSTALLTVAGDPTDPLGIATKQYVDAQAYRAAVTPGAGKNGSISGANNLDVTNEVGYLSRSYDRVLIISLSVNLTITGSGSTRPRLRIMNKTTVLTDLVLDGRGGSLTYQHKLTAGNVAGIKGNVDVPSGYTVTSYDYENRLVVTDIPVG